MSTIEVTNNLTGSEDCSLEDKLSKETGKMAESEPTQEANQTASLSIRDINSSLPPELLSKIFGFLSFGDLKNALLVCRRWMEVGQQPCLWVNFNLKLLADLTDQDHQLFEHLLQVLSLKRFQSLQHLSLEVKAETWIDKMMLSGMLSINNDTSVWVDSANLLHIVRDKHPAIEKLSLEFTTDGTEDKIAQLAEELVMFQEVDLTKCQFGSGGFKDSDAKDSTAAFLMALLTASAQSTSRLKLLTICDVDVDRADMYADLGKACFEPLEETCSEALDEARRTVTVNIVDMSYSDDDDDSYDDDDDPGFDYDDVYGFDDDDGGDDIGDMMDLLLSTY